MNIEQAKKELGEIQAALLKLFCMELDPKNGKAKNKDKGNEITAEEVAVIRSRFDQLCSEVIEFNFPTTLQSLAVEIPSRELIKDIETRLVTFEKRFKPRENT